MKQSEFFTPMSVFLAVFLIGGLWAGQAAAQQSIPNPLIKPNILKEAAMSGPASADDGGISPESAANSEQVRIQAERKISTEDFNSRQQSLNAQRVPQPLQVLFLNMAVTANLQGAVVLRRPEEFLDNAGRAGGGGQSTQTGGNGQVSTAGRGVSYEPQVIRFRLGRTMNVNGYTLRATVNGQDVSIDWLSDGGNWVNVFVGSLESRSLSVSRVPAKESIEKVDTEAFDHLRPALSAQTFSNNSSGNNSGGNSGFNSGFGSSSPGFGGGGGGANNSQGFR